MNTLSSSTIDDAALDDKDNAHGNKTEQAKVLELEHHPVLYFR
jgi:hypothetical protein